jgi:Zn ribbon nucleic-acid-binding protein
MSIERLKAMTLQPVIEFILQKSDLNSKQTWQWVIPTGSRNRTRINGLHFCSECLKESPVYFRKSWRLAWDTVCPKHHNLLSIACPACSSTISPHLVTFENVDLRKCVVCRYDLTQMPAIKADKTVVDLQDFVDSLVLSPCKTSEYPLGILDANELFEVLHFLLIFLHTAYKRLMPFQRLFSELDLRIEDGHFSHLPGTTFESYPVLERYFLMQAVSRIFMRSRADVIKIFVQTGFTRQMLSASDGRPKIIEEIYEKLLNNGRNATITKHPKKPIMPRSKTEVDVLMDEILPFL